MIASDLVVLVRAKTDKLGGDLNKSKGMFDGFGKSITGQIASVAAPAALLGYFFTIAQQMNDTSDAAEKLGISLHSYMVFDNVAKRSATSIEAIGTAINKLKRSVAEGKAGGILGMDNETLKKMSPEKAFMEAIGKIAGIRDPMQRARMEMELFGKSGAELDGVIMKLATDFKYWNESVADEKAAQALADYGNEIEDYTTKLKNLGITLGSFVVKGFKGVAAIGIGAATLTNPIDIIDNMIGDAESIKRRTQAMDAQKAQFDAMATAMKELSKMREKYDSLVDPRGNAIENFKDSIMGMNPGDVNGVVDSFTQLYDKMEAFKDAKKQSEDWTKHIEEVKKFGEELSKSTLSPFEEFQAKLAEIEKWRKEAKWRYDKTGEGIANIDEVAMRGIEQARKNAIDAMKLMKPESPSGMATFNSQEAANSIARAFAAQQSKGTTKDIEKVEKVAKEQLVVLKNIELNQKKETLAAANL